jgi:hypothetical protein
MTTAQEIETLAAQMGLSLKTEFVPFSRSRNKGEKSPSLNWKVTLWKGLAGPAVPLPSIEAHAILTTDYSAGCAHCPSYEQGNNNAPRAVAVDAECETGYAHSIMGMNTRKTGKRIAPSFADVLYSLVMDAGVIDYGNFEEWASAFGCDIDSRTAEHTYRSCLEIALKLRNGIGEEALAKLREAFTDY